MTFINLIPNIYYNVKQYGAAGNGTTDDTTAINAAITAANATGGVVFLPPGTYKISSPLNLSTANVSLKGAGASSIIQPSASFAGSNIVNITANYCGVTDLQIAYANTSYASNPAADGIQLTGAQNILIQNVILLYINGWAVQSSATAGVRNKWTKFDNIFSSLCAKGIHIVGVAANNNAAHVLAHCILDQVATGSSNGDGYLIEDCYDIECSNLECNLTAGSGAAFHIKGRCSSIHLVNFVGGCDTPTSTGPAVLIESGTNGNPSQIELTNSIFETGSIGISITTGSEITISGCRLETNATHGINLAPGGTIDTICIQGCSFNANGQTAAAGHYDINSSATGNIVIQGCSFLTPSGSGAGQTAAGVNVSAGHHIVSNNLFLGSTVFAGLPQVIRRNNGYNPVGHAVAQPTMPASTVAVTNTNGVDCTVHIAGGTLTAINIGGSSTGITAAAAAGSVHTVRVPANQTIAITYSVSPSWQWFGD